jgi:glycosidase
MVDSVMNYPFSFACREYFLTGGLDTEGFRNFISARLAAYPYPMVYAMYNLLGSHDTSRWFTEAKGDIRKVTLSLVFQFSFVGIPAIYYGDETAMEGGDSVTARRCMNFAPGEAGQKLLALCKKLVALRIKSSALCEGDFAWIKVPGNLLACKRTFGNETVWVYINNSEETVTADSLPGTEPALSSGEGGSDTIEPMGFRVFCSQK